MKEPEATNLKAGLLLPIQSSFQPHGKLGSRRRRGDRLGGSFNPAAESFGVVPW